MKEVKNTAELEEFEKVNLGDARTFKRSHFKYLGVMQSSDGDSLVAVNHRIAIAWSRYAELKRF